jgi:23S rRNA (cytidine1920-2'-O)/16S rRNA (cytidine1409-2'-O)-methyltransferase
MVKPQFEVGRERLGGGGVVRDPAHRQDAVLEVARRGRAGLGDGRASWPARCPARPATSSSSCGCAATPAAAEEDVAAPSRRAA